MKTGDIVEGEPWAVEGLEDPETVIGRLELIPVTLDGESFNTALVWCKNSDDEELAVECYEESLQPANRRAKVTVIS